MPPRREAREQSCSSQRYQPDRSDGVADGPRTTFGRRLVCHVRKPLRLGGLSRVAHVTAQSSAATRRPACTSAFSARDEGPVRAPLRPFGGMLKVTEPTEISNLFENNPRPPGVNHSAPLRAARSSSSRPPSEKAAAGNAAASQVEIANISGSNQSHLRSCFQPLNGFCALPATRRCDVADRLRF